jgi:hypothetical protein
LASLPWPPSENDAAGRAAGAQDLTVAMATRTKSSGTETAHGGLPAKRLLGREVVVVLGATEPALSLMARALHALGVDMLEGEGADLWSGEAGDWRRSRLSELNAALLEAIERPPGHPAHALPFPPAWWRRPAVQKIKRALAQEVEAALEEQAEPWGFADIATARLLPVWQEVFDQLGLSPCYIWALTHPTAHAATGGGSKARAARDAAEVRWFAYGTDIYRYAGEHIAAVIDEGDWRADPQRLIERLVDRLRIRWRGTRLDLYETVGAVVAQGQDASDEAPQPAGLPLSMSFYESAARMDEDADARARVAAMAESAELLRPLIAPFMRSLKAPDDGASETDGEEAVSLRQEIEALRQTCADLRREAESRPAPLETAPSGDGRITALELELEARVAETRWLHDHYKGRLEEVEAEVAVLRAQLAARGTGAEAVLAPGSQDEELAAAHAELRRLQSEMINLNNANERYLARIYELKKSLEDRGAMSRVGG